MGWSGGLLHHLVAHPPEQRRGFGEERLAPFLLTPREQWPAILSQHVVRVVVVRHDPQATAQSRRFVQETTWNPAESMVVVGPPNVGDVL